jgi:hypothetical protein
MNCASCGHDNPDSARFCLECGTPFALRCAGCGAELPAGAKFCLECGAAVVGAASERAAVAPARHSPRAPTSRHLADKIRQSKSALEGERKQVTVLFADVKGSMELAEQLDPEEWSQMGVTESHASTKLTVTRAVHESRDGEQSLHAQGPPYPPTIRLVSRCQA